MNKIGLNRTNGSIIIEWHDTDLIAITKEGNHGLQIAGNKYGLETFSDHLYAISQSSVSFVSYEQSKNYPNNYLQCFYLGNCIFLCGSVLGAMLHEC